MPGQGGCDFECAVIGAGAVGSAAAYHLGRAGKKTVLIEQFSAAHDRGSSHGAARITRHAYTDPYFARLMPAAFQVWRDLEAHAGLPLFLRTGGLYFGPEQYTSGIAANLDEIGIPFSRLGAAGARDRFPMFAPSAGMEAIFEPDGGALAAARIIAAEQSLARQLGVQLWEHCRIERIETGQSRCTIHCDRGPLEVERLIVAAGPWMGRLVPAVAPLLQPTRQQVLYFHPPDPTLYQPGRMPVFIVRTGGEIYYGMPALFGCGVKAAIDRGIPDDPDTMPRVVDDVYEQAVRAFLAELIPGLAAAPIERREVCVYTMTEDEDFLLGPLGSAPAVVVASCCSGHGFKFSALVGKLAAEYITRGAPSLDAGRWAAKVALL